MESTAKPRRSTQDPKPGVERSLPLLSVVVPCRDEARFVEDCIGSIAASHYPHDRLEIVAVDGMSTDGTRSKLEQLKGVHPNLSVIDNPEMRTPFAFNRGIRHSRGDLIAILNGHSVYPSDYLPRCVETMLEQSADVVGGVMVPRSRSKGMTARGFARALRHPFGIGNARYRIGGAKEPIEVDVVGYGIYRRSIFERVGLFDERLTRSQDMDLNARIRRAGGRIILEPRGRFTYNARSGILENIRYNFGNGRWVSVPVRISRARFSPRHLAPGIFVGSLLVLGLLAPFVSWARWLLVTDLSAYGIALAIATLHGAATDRDAGLLIGLPIAFLTLHLSYGAGTLWGLVVPLPEASMRSSNA